jgi:hypothetical protein
MSIKVATRRCEVTCRPERRARAKGFVGPSARWSRRGALRVAASAALTAQPRARSAVVRINEDDARLFERALYCFDGARPHRVPALKTLYRVIRHFGRAAELRQAPAESRPREETLNAENWSHHNRASTRRTCTGCHSPRPLAVGTLRYSAPLRRCAGTVRAAPASDALPMPKRNDNP